jgi:hypothetical protein
LNYYHSDGKFAAQPAEQPERVKENVMTATKPGARFRCAQCGTEVVVVKPSGDVPRCCSTEMETLSSH